MTAPSCPCCRREFRSKEAYRLYLLRKELHEKLRLEVAQDLDSHLGKIAEHRKASGQFKQMGDVH